MALRGRSCFEARAEYLGWEGENMIEAKKTSKLTWYVLFGVVGMIPMGMFVSALDKSAIENSVQEGAMAEAAKVAAVARVAEEADMVKHHRFWVGQTRAQLLKSLGRPDRINRTTVGDSASEQWVYHGNYIYVENGIVKAYQN